jgi:mannose-6-phosphate isomerase-like protein (cupin superfamily)
MNMTEPTPSTPTVTPTTAEPSAIAEGGLHTDERFWGTVTVLETGERYRISRVEVKPGHRMKTQIHYHRSEHWIVVSGTAKIVCGGNESLIIQNQSTYVPVCTPHRLENPGVIPLVLIEVQNGEFLGDEDTIRLEEDDTDG